MLLSVSTILLATQLWAVNALRLPFHRDLALEGALSPSVVFVDDGDLYNFNVVDLSGDGDIIYVANITVDGQSYEVRYHNIGAHIF